MISAEPIKAGLTGGIGSGKSVVCRLFRMLGVPVYDTDAEAKRLMSSDEGIVSALKSRFGDDIFRGGMLDRAALAAVVFGDSEALSALEAIVHPAVTKDFLRWAAENTNGAGYVIAESAILFESGMDRFMEFVVTVSAPESLRIVRAARRDGMPEEKVRERMAHQMTDTQREELADYIIRNDEQSLVWEQVIALDAVFRAVAEEENKR